MENSTIPESFAIANVIIDKIMARTLCRVTINHIMEERAQSVVSSALNYLAESLAIS